MDTAGAACADKESLQYAILCNAAGGAYYELNQLHECRNNWETFLEIQETKLPSDDLEVMGEIFISVDELHSYNYYRLTNL